MIKFFKHTQLLVFILSLWSFYSYAQEVNYKEYSYTEFFELIENETDSVFKLENAIIKYDSITDQKFMVPTYSFSERVVKPEARNRQTIDKSIELNNVQFLTYSDESNKIPASFHNFIFEKDVVITNSFLLNISDCTFMGSFQLSNYADKTYTNLLNRLPNILTQNFVHGSEFNNRFRLIMQFNLTESNAFFGLYFGNNLFKETSNDTFIATWGLEYIDFSNNAFNDLKPYSIHIEECSQSTFQYNKFNKGLPQFYCIEIDELIFKDNLFEVPSLINFKATNNVNFIGTHQFKTSTYSLDAFDNFRRKLQIENPDKSFWDLNSFDTFKRYIDNEHIEDQTAFQYELDQKSVFYNYFKERHMTSEANKYYIEIKDLESKRLEYEHNLSPSFTTFFKIQINKFLKLFSNYGTEPERAVIVSLYVIFFFALIYLFFPNSWDKHGKNRIVDRYNFFFKYMKRKAGIHEVYLEDQKEELMSYDAFKANVINAEQKVPRFFTATALPLYKWAVSGTKLSASILKRIDIMKGTWQELPQGKRLWKSVLLIGAFVVAILYDLVIKILNALMLSINTFTTLGFGEIPIKGLPRYLAIIQGFIGWFMLTIFSVSLISQLLN